MTPRRDSSPPADTLLLLPSSAISTVAPAGDQPTNRPPLTRFLRESFQHRIPQRVCPIPPAPAVLDEFAIEVHAIG